MQSISPIREGLLFALVACFGCSNSSGSARDTGSAGDGWLSGAGASSVSLPDAGNANVGTGGAGIGVGGAAGQAGRDAAARTVITPGVLQNQDITLTVIP